MLRKALKYKSATQQKMIVVIQPGSKEFKNVLPVETGRSYNYNYYALKNSLFILSNDFFKTLPAEQEAFTTITAIA